MIKSALLIALFVGVAAAAPMRGVRRLSLSSTDGLKFAWAFNTEAGGVEVHYGDFMYPDEVDTVELYLGNDGADATCGWQNVDAFIQDNGVSTFFPLSCCTDNGDNTGTCSYTVRQTNIDGSIEESLDGNVNYDTSSTSATGADIAVSVKDASEVPDVNVDNAMESIATPVIKNCQWEAIPDGEQLYEGTQCILATVKVDDPSALLSGTIELTGCGNSAGVQKTLKYHRRRHEYFAHYELVVDSSCDRVQASATFRRAVASTSAPTSAPTDGRRP